MTLFVVGDWGAGTEAQTAVAEAMRMRSLTEPAVVIITTGDNFYSDDSTSLMAPFSWVTDAGIPILITWGNHDVETAARIEAVENAFGDPPRWQLWQWGEIDIVLLDSNQVDSTTQIAFLTDTLAASDRPTIVVYHHPVFSCGRHEGSQAIMTTWMSVFDDDVVLALNGHDHNYQRFENEGVAHIVTGGGGRMLYDIASCPQGHPPLLAGESTYHFLVMKQSEGGIEVEAVTADGRTIERLTIPIP